MLKSNISIGQKRSKFIQLIQLSVIISYFALITNNQEIQTNNNLSNHINPIQDLTNISEKNSISSKKIDIIQELNLNQNEDMKDNKNPNYLSVLQFMKANIPFLIRTEKNNIEENKNINKKDNNIISFTTQQSQLNSKTTLNCKSNPKLNNLVISTNADADSDEFNIDILRECKISEMWLSRNIALKSCETPKRAIEGEDNVRRAFRFSYLAPQNPIQSADLTDSSIIINKMTLEFPKSAAESTLTKSKLTLNPGDVTDIYLNYDCKYSEESRSKIGGDNWFKLKVTIEFADKQQQSFEFIKVCNASYIESVDFSHFIIISFIFLVAYLSTKDILKSKFEVLIVEKYTEIRNPENLLLIGLVVSLILILFGVTGNFSAWTKFVIIILAPISIAMIGEALLKYYDTLTHLESRSYEIPFLGSISFLFSLCLCIGLVLVSFYFFSENWILNNLIAIAIALITIRLFKFTNFKLILIMFSLRFLYDLIWSYYFSQYFSENFRLSNNSQFNLPIKFVCPEFSSSPFNSCNFLPIADIILPGILCTYAKIFDESKEINVYFFSSNASLAAGLVLNMFVYYSYRLPLPSFLFTGPVMILTVVVIAYNKGHFHKFVEGFSSTLLENRLDKNIKKISFQQKMKSGMSANQQYVPPKI